MKKKRIISFFLIGGIFLSLSATAIDDTTHPFMIQAAYNTALDVSFSAIASQQESFAVGMPFNVEDPTVRPRSMGGLGRQIAHWSFITNTDFSMRATLKPLTHVHKGADGKPEYGTPSCECTTKLWYTLGLNFTLSYYTNANQDNQIEGTFIISPTKIVNGVSDDKELDPTGDSVPAYMGLFIPPSTNINNKDDENTITVGEAITNIDETLNLGFIGVAQGAVLLSFTKESATNVSTDDVKPGSYEGSVTIEIAAI